MTTSPVLVIPKPELLNPHWIPANDIDNFAANHEARAVLLQQALDDTCSYSEQLWDTLNAARQYLLDCIPPDPRPAPATGAAPTGPDDEQGWQTWITAFAAVLPLCCAGRTATPVSA